MTLYGTKVIFYLAYAQLKVK